MSDQIFDLIRPDSWCDIWYIPTTTDHELIETIKKIADLVDQSERADQFNRKKSSTRSSYARVAIGFILAKYLKKPLKDIIIYTTDTGKPFLECDDSDLCINLSYSHDMAVLAVSNLEVGVDIEYKDPATSVQNLLFRITTAAESQILRNQYSFMRENLFYRVWTIKESVSKNIGQGLGLDFRRLDTSTLKFPGDPIILDSHNAKFAVYPLHAPDDYTASLALSKKAPLINYFNLSCDLRHSQWRGNFKVNQIYKENSANEFWR